MGGQGNRGVPPLWDKHYTPPALANPPVDWISKTPSQQAELPLKGLVKPMSHRQLSPSHAFMVVTTTDGRGGQSSATNIETSATASRAKTGLRHDKLTTHSQVWRNPHCSEYASNHAFHPRQTRRSPVLHGGTRSTELISRPATIILSLRLGIRSMDL